MTVKAHYDNHLGNIYAWMTGDFRTNCDEFKQLLQAHTLLPTASKIAVDLGAGHGIQSIALAEVGYQVIAVDFNTQLLNSLRENAKDLPITIVHDDITNLKTFVDKAELIVCCGDTLSHLDSKVAVKTFISHLADTLEQNGKLLLSFRDYTTALTGINRIIPVKSDSNRILTCILDYEEEYVQVTDLLHERIAGNWVQKGSSYRKVRLIASEVEDYIRSADLTIDFNGVMNRLNTIVATKG